MREGLCAWGGGAPPPPRHWQKFRGPTSFLVEEERVLFWHYSSEDWNFVIVNREPTVFIVEDDLHGRSECPVRSAIDERHAGFWSKVLVLQEAISNTELFNEKRKEINLLNKLQRALFHEKSKQKDSFFNQGKILPWTMSLITEKQSKLPKWIKRLHINGNKHLATWP